MSADEKDIVFVVSSACSGCGSYQRAYSKDSRKTRCFECGKKQSHPNNLAVILHERQYQKLKNATFQEGEPCPNCQLQGEVILESGMRVCLYCNTTKGEERSTVNFGDYPILDHCPYCGNYGETETFDDEGKVVCEKCGKQEPDLLPCPKCGSERGTFSREKGTLNIICVDCGAIKLTIPNAK